MSVTTPQTAILAGATGLVGGELLTALVADDRWERVVTVGRRVTGTDHPKVTELVLDVTDPGPLPATTHVFVALGSTRRKAGSAKAFARIDHDAVVALAAAAAEAGVTWFGHVTAVGADPRSPFFYNRVKGRTERDVAASGVPATVAFRPSFLEGDRDENRLAEHAGLIAARLAAPLMGSYRPIPASVVAAAMLAAAADTTPGHRALSPAGLWRFGS